MEKLAYLLKQRSPRAFRAIEATARAAVELRYGRRLNSVEQKATITGTVDGHDSVIRPLGCQDAHQLNEFLDSLPPAYLRYFQPHSFDLSGLQSVLRSRAFLTYGLFVRNSLVCYALLKIAPTGSAYIGRLVHPDFGGMGLGKFLSGYLRWQASLAGLRARSTISRQNVASLRSHQAVSEFKIVAELPDDYLMIEFPAVPREKPELNLPKQGERRNKNGLTGERRKAKGC